MISLDRKQGWKVMMRINNWSHKMSNRKLYNIEKITALSIPVPEKIEIARI